MSEVQTLGDDDHRGAAPDAPHAPERVVEASDDVAIQLSVPGIIRGVSASCGRVTRNRDVLMLERVHFSHMAHLVLIQALPLGALLRSARVKVFEKDALVFEADLSTYRLIYTDIPSIYAVPYVLERVTLQENRS